MVHLRRLAEDFIIFTGEEYGFFELSDRVGHRQQHDAAEEEPRSARARARQEPAARIGHLTGLLATMKGLPTGYNKDLQEDKEPVFDAEDTLTVSLDATRARGRAA